VRSDDPVALPLVGLPQGRIPDEATPALTPSASPNLRGMVWLDFTRGGGGTPGVIDQSEPGRPGVIVEAILDRKVVGTATTDDAGVFEFPGLTGGGCSHRSRRRTMRT
jgi:alpha-glucoside transport system permease protein